MVFQDNNLFAHLDIRTNIGLGLDPALRLDAAAWSRVEAALDRVGLPVLAIVPGDALRRRTPACRARPRLRPPPALAASR
jgi:thiamine transport system ATP-binding protein